MQTPSSAKDEIWYLENIDLEKVLCPVKLNSPTQKDGNHIYKKGSNIFVPGELADHVYLIREGRVKVVSINSDGKEITKAVLNKGELFGLFAIMEQEHRGDYAQAMEPTEVCKIKASDLKGLIRDRSELNLLFMKLMSQRALDLERRLESMVFKDSRSRIIDFIVDMADKRGQRIGYEMLIKKFFTHQEVATLTATSRQTVTTVLNELRSRNLLTFNRRKVLIRDLDQLRAEIV